MTRRTRGFTLIELMIVVAIIAVIAAIAIPNLLRSKMVANETTAIAALHTYASGQAVFFRSQHTYARPWPQLNSLTIGGEPACLIDNAFAGATGPDAPRAGYWFRDIDTSRTGLPYIIQFDYGLSAAPARYSQSGMNSFVIDVQGTVYQKEIGGYQVTTFPRNPASAHWILPE